MLLFCLLESILASHFCRLDISENSCLLQAKMHTINRNSYAGIEAAYVRIELQVTGKDKKVQTARGILLVSFLPNYKSIDVMIDFDKPIRISPDPNYKFITEVSPVKLDEEKIHELMRRSHSVDIEALEFEEMKSRTDTAEAPDIER